MVESNVVNNKVKIAVVGLGYVGLPLAVEFSKKYSVVGFDINPTRVNELNNFIDSTNEIGLEDLRSVIQCRDANKGLTITANENDLCSSSVYIITVPTPVDESYTPDLGPMISATILISKYLSKGDIVIYESTVYPGVTEEKMVPIIESQTELILNKDFFVGYSPERINPGDKEHTVSKILKVTSGSNESSSKFIAELYSSIIVAGVYQAPSIKVAEAAKVIENSQRDINIAFVNELSKIFAYLNIDTSEVLKAAATKWNFLSFQPGLVGGHCIGVDPYYLAFKAKESGYNPEVILSGRAINDSMGAFVSERYVKTFLKRGFDPIKSKTLVLGFTFKENCPDYRNTKVYSVYKELIEYNLNVDIYDPHVDREAVRGEYGITLIENIDYTKIKDYYQGIIIAVKHNEFIKLNDFDFSNNLIYDLKGVLTTNNRDILRL